MNFRIDTGVRLLNCKNCGGNGMIKGKLCLYCKGLGYKEIDVLED